MCAAVLAAVAFVATPIGEAVPPLCPMRLLLHIPCPSCGLTRAARCLVHGNLAAATHLHPLWWLVFPFVAAVAAIEAKRYVRTGRVGGSTEHPAVPKLGVALLIALVVVWIARGLGAFGGPVPLD